MNYRQKFKQINKVINLIRISNRNRGCIKLSSANSLEHENAKFLICYELQKRKYIYYTECIFKNGSRADLLCINPNTANSLIIEILKSETIEEAKKKTNTYPENIDVMYVDIKKLNVEDIPI